MVDRSRDFGDQFPSDQDDTPPPDPTAGFQEVDYEIESLIGHDIGVPWSSAIAPDPGIEPTDEDIVRTWFALILEKVDPLSSDYSDTYPVDQYWVLRQDGKRVHAYNVTEELGEYYKTGDDVIIRKDSAGPHNDEAIYGWIIIGKEQPRESALLDLTLSDDTPCTSNPFIIPFDTIVSQLPPDDNEVFGTKQDVTLEDEGIVKVYCEGEALFHIEFTVTIAFCNPVTEGLDRISVESGCWYNAELFDVGKGISTPKIWFAKQNGFKVLWDKRDCTANVSIGTDAFPDAVLNQQFPEPLGMAFWTDSPRFGGDVSIGTQRGTAYAKIGNQSQYAWLTHGGGKIKFRFPKSSPAATPAFLMGAARKGECVQSSWMDVGGTGKIQALSCVVSHWEYCYIDCTQQQFLTEEGGQLLFEDNVTFESESYSYQYCAIPYYECYEWTVCNGLVVSGPGIEPNPFGSPCDFYPKETPATCPGTQELNDDACEIFSGE